MATKKQFEQLLDPVLDVLASMDPNDATAQSQLNERFPVDGEPMRALAEAFAKGVADGWLCDRQGSKGVTYSRVRKATTATELSIDAVRMDGPGPGHTHPDGEFDLCFAADGEPTFDGQAPGWTVYPSASWHVPTVANGTMNILYFLPAGAIQFGPKPS